MAEIETSEFNFSIEDTMEMGSGNKELLDMLYSPETVTTGSEDIKKIEEPEKKPIVQEKKKQPEGKETEKEEEKEEKDKSLKTLLEEEEEEKKEEEKEEKEGEETKAEEDEEINKFNALSKDLFKLGVFSEEEGEKDVEINTPEDLLERFNHEKRKGAIEVVDKFLGQFGEDYQNAFDAIFVKGVDPKDYFGTYNNIKDYSSLDLGVQSNQTAVIRQTLVDQGLEPEDVTAELERLENSGDLEAVAQRYHKVLVKKEAAKLAQMEQESTAKLEQMKAIKHEYITNVQTVLQEKLKNKDFDGLPLNPQLVSEIQDFLVTDKYKTPSGETLTEFDKTILDLRQPKNHEKKVKLALLMKIMEKDPTLSTIQKAGVTKKSDALFGELARQTTKTPVKSEKPTKPASWFVN